MSAILFNFPELMIVERKKKTGNCQLSFLIFLPSLHELMILGKNVSYLFFIFLTSVHELMILEREKTVSYPF